MPTFNNLNDLLEEIKGSRIVSLRTKTTQPLNVKSRVDKKPNPYTQGVSKISVRNCIIGADYANSFNNKLAKNDEVGDFVPEAQWGGKGRRVSKFTIAHTVTGQEYLAILPKVDAENHNITKSVYIDNATGNEVDVNLLREFMPPKKEAFLNWQVIKIDNIIGLKSGELEYSRA